jgi:cyclopropane fatty-acyl-phospholipid synthase-like methyltransferase
MESIVKEVSNNDFEWSKQYDYYEIELRQVYSQVARPQNLSHFEMLKKDAKEYLNKNKIFCEIGFGSGVTLRLISGFFKTVYGLDISEKNVIHTRQELLSEGINNTELFFSNIMIYEEKYKNLFDVISFIHGLEHFSVPDLPVLLDNIKSYLKEDGIFTGALPYKLPFNFRMCPHCYKTFEIDGHISRHDLESIRREFINNGFKIIHLSKFNKRYYLKTEGYLKYVYKILRSNFKNEELYNQIEFIVQKVDC